MQNDFLKKASDSEELPITKHKLDDEEEYILVFAHLIVQYLTGVRYNCLAIKCKKVSYFYCRKK